MKRYFIPYTTAVLFLCFMSLGNVSLAQQTTQSISIESLLSSMGGNSLLIKEQVLKQELAKANETKSKEWWLPDLYAGTTIHQLWGSAMNGNGEFFTSINRQNLWAGLGLNASWNFGSGIYQTQASEMRTLAAKYDSKAVRNQALLEIVHEYYDLLTSQLYYKAYENLALQADTIYQQLAVQVDAGSGYESDALLAKSNYHHLKVEMLNARIQYEKQRTRLARMLDLDAYTVLVSSDTVLAPVDLQGITVQSADNLIRPELNSAGYSLQALQLERKTTTKGLWLPELKLGTYTSYFGDVFSPVNPTTAVNASLLWKIPMGRLTSGGELEQYDVKIAIQQNELAQTKALINEEVTATNLLITTSNEQMVIALEGSTLAEQALNQSIDRQRLGTVRPFEIIQAQEVYIQSRLDYLSAVARYNKAQFSKYVAEGNDL